MCKRGRLVMVWSGAVYIACQRNQSHRIRNGRLKTIGPFGPKRALFHPCPLNFFFFFYFILLYHCEVTHKNNHLICTNIFFIYNRLQISCIEEVSIIIELIYYFQQFK